MSAGLYGIHVCLLVVCLPYQDVNLMKARLQFLYWYFFCIVLPTLFQACPQISVKGRKAGGRAQRVKEAFIPIWWVSMPSAFHSSPVYCPWPVQSLSSHLTVSLLVPVQPHPAPPPTMPQSTSLKHKSYFLLSPLWMSKRKYLQNTYLIKDVCLEHIKDFQNLIEQNKQPFFKMCKRYG